MTWLWLAVAILSWWGLFYSVEWALRPRLGNADWFWVGGPDIGRWVPADQGISVSWVESIPELKPEQSDPPESKPTSGAG